MDKDAYDNLLKKVKPIYMATSDMLVPIRAGGGVTCERAECMYNTRKCGVLDCSKQELNLNEQNECLDFKAKV